MKIRGRCVNCGHPAVCYTDETEYLINKEDAFAHVCSGFVTGAESKGCQYNRTNGKKCLCDKPFFDEKAHLNTEG